VPTLLTLDLSELLLIKRSLKVTKAPLKDSQRDKSSIQGVKLETKCINWSLMEEVMPMWLN